MIARWRLFAVVVLALTGAAVSVYLTGIHIDHICTGIPSSCNFNESINCDAVNTSRQSELAGVPVAHLGMLTYLFVLGIAIAAMVRERFRPRAHAYLFLTSLWCVVFSAYMAFVALAIIKALCVWCAALYVVNILLAAALWGGGFRAAYGTVEHLATEWRWLKRPAGIALMIAFGAGVAGSSVYLRGQLKICKAPPIIRTQPPDITGRPASGPDNAKVTIIEISDFECPFCRKASGTLTHLLEKYQGKVRLVFMHFPLDNACNPAITRPFHQNACLASKAAWCAGARGFYWKYAKGLFEGELDRPALIAAAKGVGLDPVAFTQCLDSKEAADGVAKDIDACMKIGVHQVGVPFFLINGRQLVGAQPPERFKEIIDQELASH